MRKPTILTISTGIALKEFTKSVAATVAKSFCSRVLISCGGCHGHKLQQWRENGASILRKEGGDFFLLVFRLWEEGARTSECCE